MTKNGKFTHRELAVRMLQLIKTHHPSLRLDRIAKRRYKLHKQGIRPTYAPDNIKSKFVSDCTTSEKESAPNYHWDMAMLDTIKHQDAKRAKRIPTPFMAATMRVVGPTGNQNDDLTYNNAIDEHVMLMRLGYAAINKEPPPVMLLEYRPTYLIDNEVHTSHSERVVIDLTDE